MSNHIMIDIETLDTGPDAAVLTIGAAAFQLEDDDVTEQFETTISMESNEQFNRKISASTLGWWLQQKPEALAAMFEGQITNLRNACKTLRVWAQQLNPAVTHVWANDPDFDIVILRRAYDAVGEMWPYHFSVNRSMRTITELAYPEIDEKQRLIGYFRAAGTHHKAVDDAIAQAKVVQHCYQRITHGLPENA